MPITYIASSSSSTVNITSGEDTVVTNNVTISAQGSAIYLNAGGAESTGNTLFMDGTLYGNYGIDLYFGPTTVTDAFITIGAQGSVTAFEDAILLRSGAGNAVVNNGEITAQQTGVYFHGGDNTLTNHGTITSYGERGQAAVIFNNNLDGGARVVVNTGIIEGGPVGGAATAATISNIQGTNFILDNSGSILGVGATAIYSSAATNEIDNSGVIAGDITIATNPVSIYTQITNSGLISGDITSAVQISLVNTGTIGGNVTLSDFDDTYAGYDQGLVTGQVFLGDGADFAKLSNVGEYVDGGSGDDTVLGGTGNDVVFGDGDSDLIRGRAGDDALFGGDGADTIRAGQGDDEVFGGDGDDVIRGGAGEDIIDGGLGSDTMFGGADADVFVFTAQADSPDNSGRDVIQDFVVGEDQIDLSALGTLDFIGNGTFSGTGGEVSVSDPNSIGRVKILVDVDGDGTADMKIVLNNTTMLSEDDFIL